MRPGGPGRPAARRPAPAPGPAEGGSGLQRSVWGRVAVALIAVMAVAAAVAIGLLVAHSGRGSSSNRTGSSSTSASRSTARGATRATTLIDPAHVIVAVLNGTAVNGLAHRTALRLSAAGFRQGDVATAPDQTHTATTVDYMPGDRNDALAVAKTLNLSQAAVQAIDPSTRAVASACVAGTSQSACTPNVVVVVGADLAG